MQETKLTITKTVTEDMLAVNVGSGSLRVLATPTLAALFENASMNLAAKYLDEGSTTVGCSITVNHNAPSPLGAEITVTAVLTKHEGRFFDFSLTASDNKGEVATGVHQRVSVFSNRFQEKANSKL